MKEIQAKLKNRCLVYVRVTKERPSTRVRFCRYVRSMSKITKRFYLAKWTEEKKARNSHSVAWLGKVVTVVRRGHVFDCSERVHFRWREEFPSQLQRSSWRCRIQTSDCRGLPKDRFVHRPIGNSCGSGVLIGKRWAHRTGIPRTSTGIIGIGVGRYRRCCSRR